MLAASASIDEFSAQDESDFSPFVIEDVILLNYNNYSFVPSWQLFDYF